MAVQNGCTQRDSTGASASCWSAKVNHPCISQQAAPAPSQACSNKMKYLPAAGVSGSLLTCGQACHLDVAIAQMKGVQG